MPGTRNIVMFVAFDRDERGEIIPAFTPRQVKEEAEAIHAVEILGRRHTGAVAWRRESNPAVGEMGDPIIIAQQGPIGEFS